MKLKLTLKEALHAFREEIYPLVVAKYGKRDRIALREEYNNYLDALNKDGMLTDKQVFNASNPF